MIETKKIGEHTGLRLGSSKVEIPMRLMQSTREAAILVTESGVRKIAWYGVLGEYLLLPDMEIEEITLITTKYRSMALELIRKIAMGLKSASDSFLDLLSGVFPLYRIYIVSGKNILLLPPDAGEILSLSKREEDKDREVRFLIKPDEEKSYTLLSELAQLLYYAVTGRFPYERSEVRGSGFTTYPLPLYTEEESCASTFIMNILNMNVSGQRKLCLNYNVKYPLVGFFESTENMEWPYVSRDDADRIFSLKKAEESPLFKKEQEKKEKVSRRKRFFREKGVITIAIIIAVLTVSFFVGNYLYRSLKAPLTKDLTPTEIIEYTIERQNELDASLVNEGFKKEAAQYDEVSSLYVISKTREAYEGKSYFINAQNFVSSGITEVPAGSFIYGAIIKEIESDGDNTYTAILDWYTPYAFTDEDEENYPEKEGYVRTFLYSLKEHFTFTYNSRGWWECTDSYFSDAELVKIIYTPQSQT